MYFEFSIDDEAADMISTNEYNRIMVHSFSTPGVEYQIDLNEEDNRMTSCSCLDFVNNGSNCKHMYLVNRVERIGLRENTRAQRIPQSRHEHQVEENEQQLLQQSILRYIKKWKGKGHYVISMLLIIFYF
jgi:hypothetical protein